MYVSTLCICVSVFMCVYRGMPLKVRVTSMMFEDRTGYQLFTIKLSAADTVVDQAKYAAQPDIMMEQIQTADGGQPLFIRFGGGW